MGHRSVMHARLMADITRLDSGGGSGPSTNNRSNKSQLAARVIALTVFRGSNVYSAAGCRCDSFERARYDESHHGRHFFSRARGTQKTSSREATALSLWAQFYFFNVGVREKARRIYPAPRSGARVIVHVPLSRALLI